MVNVPSAAVMPKRTSARFPEENESDEADVKVVVGVLLGEVDDNPDGLLER